MLLYQHCGSLVCWDLLDPVGEVTPHVVEFVDRIVAVPRSQVDQYREVTVVPDKQMLARLERRRIIEYYLLCFVAD
jgi:hypothetical protein